MLLRVFSLIFLFSFIFSCNLKEEKNTTQTIFKVSVLSLFKPQESEIAFPDDIFIIMDNNQKIFVKKSSKIFVKYLNSHLIIKINQSEYVTNQISFLTKNHNPYYNKFTLILPKKISRDYIGGLEVKSGSNQILFLLLQYTEDLVLNTLSSESNDTELEYLKSLSVIIRTYILYNKGRHQNEGFDFCDNTHCIVHFGIDKINKNYEKAVHSTKNEVLTYNNNLIDVFFTGSCGGETLTPSEVWRGYNTHYPYSKIYCNFCKESKYANWSWNTTFKDLSKNLNFKINKINICDSIPALVILSNINNKLFFTKDEFRLLIGRKLGWNKILSNHFDIHIYKDTIHFFGKGFGHCIGFCQSGAEMMSSLGNSYEDILSYYYPKRDIKK